MARLTAAAIAAADDRPVTEVEVPEWGGSVLMRSMTAARRIQVSKRFADLVAENTIPILLAETLVDDDGAPLFDEKGIEVLAQKNPVVIDRLGEQAMKLNGIGSDAKDDAAKN